MGRETRPQNRLMTAKEAALKWNVSVRQVQIYCKQGILKGAFKLGNSWIIPSDCQKPVYRFVSETRPAAQT